MSQYLFVFFVVLLAWLFLGPVYIQAYLHWEKRNRQGMAYYGKTLLQRRRFKQKIRLYSSLMPAALLLESLHRALSKKQAPIPSFRFQNVTFPSYSCSEQSVRKAIRYSPTDSDVFVVTQMKCGTTWMQQIVLQILSHGSETSPTEANHLYAISPWIESFDGIPIEQAPSFGNPPRRVIKTHLPASLCPYNATAKFIYVTRHPASCYASILDYFKLMAGELGPDRSRLLEWFCSDSMWFSPWPEHVGGWLKRSAEPNVLICSFEIMKKNLNKTIEQVAKFLDVTLSSEAIVDIASRCSFEYMRDREEQFEMCPPNFFAVRGPRYFVGGSAKRFKSLTNPELQRILEFCPVPTEVAAS